MIIYLPQELKDFDRANITVLDTWNGDVELKVDMVNTYDHDQDGVRTNQTANYIFSIFANSKYIEITQHSTLDWALHVCICIT